MTDEDVEAGHANPQPTTKANPKFYQQQSNIPYTKGTTATMVQNPTSDMPPYLNDPSYAAYGIGGAAVAGLMYLRRKFSRDNVEVAKDRTEGQLLETIMRERNAAVARSDELLAKSAVDAGLIAGLQERNRYLQDELVRVNAAMTRLETQFEELKTTLQKITNESRKPLHIPTENQ